LTEEERQDLKANHVSEDEIRNLDTKAKELFSGLADISTESAQRNRDGMLAGYIETAKSVAKSTHEEEELKKYWENKYVQYDNNVYEVILVAPDGRLFAKKQTPMTDDESEEIFNYMVTLLGLPSKSQSIQMNLILNHPECRGAPFEENMQFRADRDMPFTKTTFKEMYPFGTSSQETAVYLDVTQVQEITGDPTKDILMP
jgi:hypothetical protein